MMEKVRTPMMLLLATGCYQYEPLTEGQKGLVEEAILLSEIYTPCVQTLSETMDQNTIFDDEGSTGTVAFSNALDSTIETLNAYYNEGKVYSVSTTSDTNGGAYNTSRDIIGLNFKTIFSTSDYRADYPYVISQSAIHEASHAYSKKGHSLKMNNQIKNHSHTNEYAETIIREKDYSYLVSFWFNMVPMLADHETYQFDDSQDRDNYDLSEAINNAAYFIEQNEQTPQQTYDSLITTYLQSETAWADTAVEKAGIIWWREGFPKFGVTDASLTSMLTSETCPMYEELYYLPNKEEICLFAAQYPEINAPLCDQNVEVNSL